MAYAWSMTMHDKKEQSPRKQTPSAFQRLPDGRLVELIYNKELKTTAFAVFHEGKITIEETVELDGDTVVVPIRAKNDLIRHEALLLPEIPEPYGTLTELVRDIRAYLNRYVDLSESFQTLVPYYVLLTWVYDAFNELPYLRFRGEYGSGKTRALSVVGSLCYKAFMAGGASTVSPIFHTLDMFRGTLILDESDFRFSDATSELVKIFNNGNVRGFPVLRTAITGKRDFEPRAFDVFGPKIVAMRRAFEDPALESRFLTEEMGQRRLRKDIPINLPDIQKEEARSLRNKLLMYRFENLSRITVDDSLGDPGLSPRVNQILLPLLAVVDDEALRAELCTTARSLDRALSVEMGSTLEADMLRVLNELIQANPSHASIPISDITANFSKQFGSDHSRPITHRYVGEIIRKRLHLATYKSHGVYVVPMTEKTKIEHLCDRYSITERDKEGNR